MCFNADILCIAAIYDLELWHLDVKTAFLNGKLDKEIYLRKPEILGSGFWRLKKGLYGLKQSGRQWYIAMNDMYRNLGFTRCESEWAVQFHRPGSMEQLVITTNSVDDILMAMGHAAKVTGSPKRSVVIFSSQTMDQ